MAISRGLQRKFLIAGILVGAGLIMSTLMSMKRPPEEKEVDTRAPLVEVLALEPMNERFSVESQGTVRPRTETILSAEVSGTITEISPNFVAGGVFSAGEVLLIPMAISLSFGILFAMLITLFLVPCLYMLQLDGFAGTRYLWDLLWGRPERTSEQHSA